MSSIFSELKRRNVVRVGVAYAVVSWLLIQAAGVLEPALLLPDWVDRVVTVFLLIGFPIVLIFAWAFELTPEGLKLTSKVDPGESITPKTGKKLEHTIIALLAIVVIAFGVREFWSPEQITVDEALVTSPVAASIAVLPFEDYSEDKDQDYFSKGIAEEILNLLAKTDSLQVAARTSSFAFADTDLGIRDIGKKLDVGTVLEGSIRKAGPNIRITAQLIDVDNGYHLWSETYDRDYEDIFRIQDEIAASILAALKVHLLGEDELTKTPVVARTVNLDAYNAYLIGKERFARRTTKDIEAAVSKFNESIELDPEFAPVHASLAHALLSQELFEFGGDGVPLADNDSIVPGHIEKALALDPESADAIAVQGLYLLKRFRYEEAGAVLNRAIQLNPSHALAYTWRADVAYEQERFLDMLADKEKAYALDPVSFEVSANLAFEYRSFWRPADAQRVIDRMFELHPDHPLAYDAALQNLTSHGRMGEGLLLVDKALAIHPEDQNLLEWRAWMLLQVGLFDEALAMEIAQVNYVVHAFAGDFDKAQQLLNTEIAEDDKIVWATGAEIDLYRMMGHDLQDPKFGRLVERYIGNLEAKNVPWRERCDPFLVPDLRETDYVPAVEGIMEQCHKVFEERLKVNYLCPCTFFGVVMYTLADGRVDEGMQRANQWLDNGDSNAVLEYFPLIELLKNHPGYQDLIARNEQQLTRQRDIYASGSVTNESQSSSSP